MIIYTWPALSLSAQKSGAALKLSRSQDSNSLTACIMCWTTRLTTCINIHMAKLWELMALLQQQHLS